MKFIFLFLDHISYTQSAKYIGSTTHSNIMSAQEVCKVCSDNFIVSSKCINCKYCQKAFHPQCVKIKDGVYKVIQESENIFWSCDTCRPVVMDKLAANLIASPRGESPSRIASESDQNAECASLLRNIERFVCEMVTEKINVIQSENLTLKNELLNANEQLRSEISALKDSNIDLVRLLTQRNAPLPGYSSLSFDKNTLQPEVTGDPRQTSKSISSVTNSVQQAKHGAKASTPSLPASAPSGSVSNRKGGNTKAQTRKPQHSGGTTTGTSATKGSGAVSAILKTAPKGRNWIWVGGLARDTSSEDIINHLKPHFPDSDLLAFDLKSKSKKKSFKVGSIDISTEKLLGSDLWPEGILLKPFRSLPKSRS